MKLAGRIAVEPLDDERLTNIERRVVASAAEAAARGRRAPRRLAGRLIAAAALAVAWVIGWALHTPPEAPVVAEPAPIRVDSAARARLDIGDARIESGPDTAFVVSRPAGGVLVAMTRGKVELEVGKRGGRPPLIVRAGDTDVIVVGTRFSVDYGDGGGEVDVRVTEGVVRVVHQQQETRVAAGAGWQTRRGLVAAREATGEAASGAVQAPPRPDGETVGMHIGAAPPVLHGRRTAVPEVGDAGPGGAGASPATASRSDDGAPRPRVKPSDPRGDLRTAIRGQRVEPALDLHEPDAAKAIARYYDIAAHQSGDEASQAFYSIAVVRHLRLGRNVEALQTLDAYVRRFPGGKEYRAALWLRVRILCANKLDDRCRAAAYTFVHEAPDDPAARTAELVTLSD